MAASDCYLELQVAPHVNGSASSDFISSWPSTCCAYFVGFVDLAAFCRALVEEEMAKKDSNSEKPSNCRSAFAIATDGSLLPNYFGPAAALYSANSSALAG